MADEHDMIGPNRPPQKRHQRISWRAVAFAIVAVDARTHEVFPRVASPPSLRYDMVNGQRDVCSATVLASMAVTTEDIFSRKDDLLERDTDVHTQAHNTRIRHPGCDGTKESAIACSDQLRFAEIQKDDRLSNVADRQRLIVVVQHEYFSAQPAIRSNCGFDSTEDLNASFRTLWSKWLRGCLKHQSDIAENIA